MVAYTKPQHRKREESEHLRGERDQIKYIDLGFERWNILLLKYSETLLVIPSDSSNCK